MLLRRIRFNVATSGRAHPFLLRHAFTSRLNAPTRNTPEPHAGSYTRSAPSIVLYGITRWSIDDAVKGEGLAVNYKRHLAAADGRVLGELLALSLVVADCTSAMGPAMLRNANTSAAALAAHFGIDLDRVMRDAQVAVRAHRRAAADGSAAGAARRELDATAAFIEQHGAAAGDAGSPQAHDGP